MNPVRVNLWLVSAALMITSTTALTLGVQLNRVRVEIAKPLAAHVLDASEIPELRVEVAQPLAAHSLDPSEIPLSPATRVVDPTGVSLGPAARDTSRLVLVVRPKDCPASAALARHVERTVRAAGAPVVFAGILFDAGRSGETPRVLLDLAAAGMPVTPVRRNGLSAQLAGMGYQTTPVLLAFDGRGRLRAALAPDRLTHAKVSRLVETLSSSP